MAYEQIQPGQSILDIGIGTGLRSILFRKAGLTVHGMETSQDMLEACRTKGSTGSRDTTFPKTQNSTSPASGSSTDKTTPRCGWWDDVAECSACYSRRM